MNKQDFLEIGRIVKTHGVHGEIILEAKNSDLLENIEESMILEIDGLLVPFFIQEFKATSQERFRIKFDWVTNETQAKKITNCPAFISQKNITIPKEKFEENLQLLDGFLVSDAKYGELGTINYITTDINNPIMSITYKKREILIPIHPDFIQKINQRKKTLSVNCPEGLIDLYFE